MNKIFSNCSSLISLPDIYKWNLSNVKEKDYIFEEFLNLLNNS